MKRRNFLSASIAGAAAGILSPIDAEIDGNALWSSGFPLCKFLIFKN